MSRITLTEKYVPEGNIIIYSNGIGKSRKERIFEVEWGVAEPSKIKESLPTPTIKNLTSHSTSIDDWSKCRFTIFQLFFNSNYFFINKDEKEFNAVNNISN